MLSIIVATARHGAIGRKGDQPFYIREDLRHFKRLTTDHTIVMGRRTFEALPKGALPDRRNIVVTRNGSYRAEGAECVHSIEDALRLAEEASEVETFVIGGGETYRQALMLADRLYVTEIDAEAEDADTFFPPIDPAEWQITSTGEWKVDENTSLRFRFVCYSRK